MQNPEPLRRNKITEYFKTESLNNRDGVQKLMDEVGSLVSEMVSTVPDGRKVGKVSFKLVNIPDRLSNPDGDYGQIRIFTEA